MLHLKHSWDNKQEVLPPNSPTVLQFNSLQSSEQSGPEPKNKSLLQGTIWLNSCIIQCLR